MGGRRRRWVLCPHACALLIGCSAATDDSSSTLDAAFPLDAALMADAAAPSTPDASAPDAQLGSDASDALAATPRADAAAEAGVSAAPAPLVDAPTYKGTLGSSSACTQSFRTLGYAPASAAGKRHALFLYFVGTSGGASDDSARFDGKAPNAVTRAMAERGFVALSVEYDNALTSIFTNKLACLYGKQNVDSLLARACAHAKVDCDLGIATWGHSQGALLAHAAANDEPRVRAVWTTGYSGLPGAKLAADRFRTVNGENDAMNASVAVANKTAGFGAADACADDGRDSCLRSDGSGWIIVRKSACQLGAADHCWFNKQNCIAGAETLEPSWVEVSSTAPFALNANADWVAHTLARP